MISIVILLIQIWLLAIIAFWLHSLSPRLGLTPIFFYIAAMVAILNFAEIIALWIQPFDGLILRTGGHVFVPIILLILLVLYISDGTLPAQVTVFGLTGVNLLVLFVVFFLTLYLNLAPENTLIQGVLLADNPISLNFMRGVAASLVAFVVDMYTIIIVYQGLRNAFQLHDSLNAGIALIAAMWVDSIVFNLLFLLGTADYALIIPSDIIAKTIIGFALAPVAGIYLTYFAPKLPDYMGGKGRKTLEIIQSSIWQVNQTLQELQQELVVSRATYKQLTDNINEIFWLTDIQGRDLLYISPAFERITGYDTERFDNQLNSLLDIMHPDDKQSDDTVFSFMQRMKNDEFRIYTKAGGYRWVRNRIFPIHDRDGVLYRYAGIAEDVTELRAIQEKEIDLQVAEEKMRVLNEFIRDASHDLKTPLSAIMLKVDAIRRAKDDEQRNSVGIELKERAMHLSNLIDDLFTLSRIEGREDMTVQPVDFVEIAKQTIKSSQPIAEAKALTFTADIPETNMRVFGNSDQLGRVVGNLVSNAVRYTERGEVTVRLWIDDAGINFSVKDTGIGIPAEDLERIFDRFYRADTARSAQIEGTGLGLAICKAIVEIYGGTIIVNSIVGIGTEFHVILPRDQLVMINDIQDLMG